MIAILKTLGLGFLCTILSPLIALVLVLYFVYTLLGFTFMSIINIFKFFKGKSILDELEEDKKAKTILENKEKYEKDLREAFASGVNPFQINNSSINSVDDNKGGEQ